MMAAKLRLGQTAEIAGPKKAFVIPKPEVAASMIKKAKRPLLVVGSKASDLETSDGTLIESAIRLSKTGKVSVVATGHVIKKFVNRGAHNIHSMQLMNLSDRLRDPEWQGLDGNGPYDLVLFAGTLYYMEWLVLSGLKSFASDLRTISLDWSYQPNANWTLGAMTKEKWKEVLDVIISNIEEEE